MRKITRMNPCHQAEAGLQAPSDTHHLPPTLPILDKFCPQLSPLLVSADYLGGGGVTQTIILEQIPVIRLFSGHGLCPCSFSVNTGLGSNKRNQVDHLSAKHTLSGPL